MPSGGTFSTSQSVAITCDTPGSAIRYTTNGSTPTATFGSIYTAPVQIDVDTTLNAIGYVSGMTDSPVATGDFNIKVDAPDFSPAGGNYTSAQSVTISSTTASASIRYTVDGSTPTSSTGTLYAGPVSISITTTLRAIAYKSGMTDSDITSDTYNINLPDVGTPTFSPPAGTYATAQNISISCPTSGATIRYTQNGSEPTESDSTVASGGSVTVSSSQTLKAKAFKSGMAASNTTSAAYELKVVTPTMSPAFLEVRHVFTGQVNWRTTIETVGCIRSVSEITALR
jgi:hypothetical protein